MLKQSLKRHSREGVCPIMLKQSLKRHSREGGNPDKYLIGLELPGFLPTQELSFCKQHNAEGK